MRRSNAELILKNSSKFTQSCLNNKLMSAPQITSESPKGIGKSIIEPERKTSFDDTNASDFEDLLSNGK